MKNDLKVQPCGCPGDHCLMDEDPCPKCNGEGFVLTTNIHGETASPVCAACNGTGAAR